MKLDQNMLFCNVVSEKIHQDDQAVKKIYIDIALVDDYIMGSYIRCSANPVWTDENHADLHSPDSLTIENEITF